MQWLEVLLGLEAGTGFLLASWSCKHLLVHVRAARTAARRLGAAALALVCASLSLEALAFLASPALEGAPAAREASAFLVRSALLLASGAISVLLLRNGRSRL